MLPTAPLQAGAPGPSPSVALVVLGLLVLAVFARRALQRLLAMLATEPVGAGEVSPGMVELEGAVVPDGGTVAVDVDGQRTEAVVAQSRRRSQGEGVAGFALPVLRRLAPHALYETSTRPFYLEDETGRVLVDAARADVSLEGHSRHDGDSAHASAEAWLGPGDDVYILGEAVPAAAYPDRASLPRGFTRWLVGGYEGDTGRTPEAPLGDEGLVVTRTARTSEFVVSDTTGGYSPFRQGLMAAFWTLSGLIAVGGGVYFLVTGM